MVGSELKRIDSAKQSSVRGGDVDHCFAIVQCRTDRPSDESLKPLTLLRLAQVAIGQERSAISEGDG